MGIWGLSLYTTLGRTGGPTKSTWAKEGGCHQPAQLLVAVTAPPEPRPGVGPATSAGTKITC